MSLEGQEETASSLGGGVICHARGVRFHIIDAAAHENTLLGISIRLVCQKDHSGPKRK